MPIMKRRREACLNTVETPKTSADRLLVDARGSGGQWETETGDMSGGVDEGEGGGGSLPITASPAAIMRDTRTGFDEGSSLHNAAAMTPEGRLFHVTAEASPDLGHLTAPVMVSLYDLRCVQ